MQLANYYKANSTNAFPEYYDISLETFCDLYIKEAEAEGIRVEVAFCQAMHETGWLQFEGTVAIEQNNFAGLGDTDSGGKAASFSDVQTGIRAQIQHLKAYANKDPLVNECVDPRFNLVKRGSAQYVERLGQKENPNGYGWATAKDYGYRIVNLMKELNNY